MQGRAAARGQMASVHARGRAGRPADFLRRLSGRRRDGAGDRAGPRRAAQGRSAHRGDAGELENQLVTAQIAHDAMVSLTAAAKPGPDTTSAMMCRRTILGTAILRAGEKALEARRRCGLLSIGGSRALLPRPAGRPLSSTPGKRADVPDRARAARFAVRGVGPCIPGTIAISMNSRFSAAFRSSSRSRRAARTSTSSTRRPDSSGSTACCSARCTTRPTTASSRGRSATTATRSTCSCSVKSRCIR